MKKIIQHIALIVATAAVVVGCENEVEFRGEDMASFPVLYSVVSPEEPVRAYYSSSVFILDDASPVDIDNATVELYINDTFRERLELVREPSEYGNSRLYYQGTITVSPLDRVTVRARSPRFPEWVSGTTVVPEAVNVGEYAITLGNSAEEGRVAGKATLPISDPDGENYYWLESTFYVTRDPSHPYGGYSYPMNYTDVAFSSGRTSDILMDYISDSPDFALFDDSLIEGVENYTLSMEWEFGEYYLQYPVTFTLKCCQLDENLFKYYRSVVLADNASEMFGEPVQIYTNIEGGLGLVGSRSVRVVTEVDGATIFGEPTGPTEEW